MEENSHPCTCEKSASLAFLDTSLSIKNGQVSVDLYRKPTDRNQYLLTSSCHPAHVTTNIPFSLALRIVRICSDPEARDKRLEELECLLLARGYKAGMVKAAVDKARKHSKKLKEMKASKDQFLSPNMTPDYHP